MDPVFADSILESVATVSFLDPFHGGLSALVHHQKSRGLRESHTEGISQCLLRISEGFFFPLMWWYLVMLAAFASLVLWKASTLCHLWSFPCGMEAVLTTDSLSPNIMAAPFTGTPRYLSEVRWSMICSVQVLMAMYSEPKVAISTVPWSLEYQSMGVEFHRCKTPVTDLPLIRSW
jgi:hypothetical protein